MHSIIDILTFVYDVIREALFPLSSAERELLSYTPEQAFSALSHSSSMNDLAIPEADAASMSAIFSYKDERVSKLVWDVKYKRSAKAVAIGAYALWRGLRALPHSSLILIPMPITKKRRRERGFNQCELLADAVKRLDAENRFTVEKNLLIRTQHAERQTLKGRAERIEGARGIFAVDDSEIGRGEIKKMKSGAVVIIDDVITTGSTMKEAMDTLTEAGFEKVYGLSLAH